MHFTGTKSSKFKQIRNKVVTAIRNTKKSLLDNLANRLKTMHLLQETGGQPLNPLFLLSINRQFLDQDGTIQSEDFDKANVLNDFFCKQTMLNDEKASRPELPLFVGVGLSNSVVTSDEVESVLKALPTGKATGPDGINNCILRELAHELSSPLCSLSNQSLSVDLSSQTFGKKHTCV